MFIFCKTTSVKKPTLDLLATSSKELNNHNGRGKKFTTRNDGEWKLIYAEIYKSEKDARERERKLKHHGSVKHELIKRLRNTLLDT